MSEIQKMYDNMTNNQARDSEYVAIALKDIVIKLEAKIDRLQAENAALLRRYMLIKTVICEYSNNCDYIINNHRDYCPHQDHCPFEEPTDE